MKHHSKTKPSSCYTIEELSVLTGKHRTTLLNLINGRHNRNRPPLGTVSDVRIVFKDNRYKCLYSQRLYIRITKYYDKLGAKNGKA
jgi:hypothetical protein